MTRGGIMSSPSLGNSVMASSPSRNVWSPSSERKTWLHVGKTQLPTQPPLGFTDTGSQVDKDLNSLPLPRVGKRKEILSFLEYERIGKHMVGAMSV